MGGDYFPWSEEAEEAYEKFAYERDLKLHNEIMAAIDADGGDISHLLYPDPSDPIQLDEDAVKKAGLGGA